MQGLCPLGGREQASQTRAASAFRSRRPCPLLPPTPACPSCRGTHRPLPAVAQEAVCPGFWHPGLCAGASRPAAAPPGLLAVLTLKAKQGQPTRPSRICLNCPAGPGARARDRAGLGSRGWARSPHTGLQTLTLPPSAPCRQAQDWPLCSHLKKKHQRLSSGRNTQVLQLRPTRAQ